MLKVGVRVVRGPNWSWGNEDGGEGFAGILREINLTNKTAVVQWDNGNQMQCRVGCLDKYDIRLLDNAQIGINHKSVICDECNSGHIHGMRYKCMNCYDFDLCSLCYHGDKHDLSHSFKRIELPDSRGINLPPRLSFRKCELRGIFKGAEVVRGVDWEWRNQDGGQGKLGIVLDIRGWKHKSDRSTAYVQWLHGNTELYRLGHKGLCDVQFVEASSGGFYYPEHLPVLGQTEEKMEWEQILDFIEIEQVLQLESKAGKAVVVKDDESENWEREKHSTLVQLGSIESVYASKIIEHNSALSRGTTKLDLINEFSNTVCGFRNDEVKEIWEMTKRMAQLPEIPLSKDVLKTRYTKKFIEDLVENGKKFLENSFKNYMTNEINKSISQDSRIDISKVYVLVHTFVGLRFQGEYMGLQDGMIDDRPLWPMVYYCIRVGDLSTAIFCLESSHLAFQEIISILKAKMSTPNDPLIGVLEENVRFSYRSSVRNETDPFKRTVWSLLGGFDELSEVIKTADDYLWFKLNMIHVDVYNQYADLQYMILEEHGELHYDAFNKPLLYFKLLILTGQFEAAIDFLFRTENFKAEGVHIAIALHEINLLALSQDSTLPLISLDSTDPKPARHLNLTLPIKSYVSKFEQSSLNGALHYFFLLRNCTDSEDRNLFEVLVSDLAINTKEYERIFGKVQAGGVKTKGLIDQFKNVDVRVEMVAETLIKKELYEEAIDLYDAVNNMEAALSLMCLMLSKVAHLENQPNSIRSRIQQKATVLEEQLPKDGDKIIPTHLITSFIKLKGLLKFFDLYRAKHYPDALKELINLEILPLRFEELNERVKNMKYLNEDFYRVVPDVLLATMTTLLAQCDTIKKTKNIFLESVADDHLRCIWEQANCIINFAERLPRKITGYVTNRLIQMEVLMHS
ncbi:nuclear pore complex protein Nup93 [Anoplophora glabripennis]|uniref:Nuclear pore protein n=1 Tax=Anoplophora glabripennis TaxID=217634 RepID=V5GUP7_ANOGL|nr:nuclear pore complex protein Nup93 [Anoplophora glabripennis]